MHHIVAKVVRFDFGVEVFRILPTDIQGVGHLGSGWLSDEEYIMVMRLIPAIAEMVIFAPALWFFLMTYNKDMSDKKNVVIWFAILLVGPALFIDHGHYQFNQVMHGLVLFAISFAMRDQFELATIFMVLAVNFKQTALYFALPFVVYTIARLAAINRTTNIAHNVNAVVTRLFILGAVFIALNVLLWKPWLFREDYSLDLDSAKQVWNRIFPVHRGIFEDKVSTFWCMLQYCTPFKPNTMLSRNTQFVMTMTTTIIACMPSCYNLW